MIEQQSEPVAQTKDQWELEQQRLEQEAARTAAEIALQRHLRGEEVKILNADAVSTAIRRLLVAHPTEFERLLLDEREIRGIEKEVASDFGKYLEELDSALNI